MCVTFPFINAAHFLKLTLPQANNYQTMTCSELSTIHSSWSSSVQRP